MEIKPTTCLLLFLLFLFIVVSCFSQNFNQNYRKGLADFVEFRYDTVKNRWNVQGRYSFIHDSKGNIKAEIFKSWNKKTRLWEVQSQSAFKYNHKDQLTEKLSKNKRFKSGALEPVQKVICVYKNDLKTEEQYFDISKKTAWLKKTINRYEYDTAGHLVKTIISTFKNKTFLDCASEIREYDMLGRIVQTEWDNYCGGNKITKAAKSYEYTWDSLLNKETLKYEDRDISCNNYTYLEKKLSENLCLLWNKKDSIWNENHKEKYIYNMFGDIIEMIRMNWSTLDSSLKNERRILYVYNPELQLIFETEQKWSVKKASWYNVFRREYHWMPIKIDKKEKLRVKEFE
ncbi:MAG: hypothetical protein HY840_01110 [Bacteroidetes bacterium]|nr:hypothetical protein [Bacteroidota bacterium]